MQTLREKTQLEKPVRLALIRDVALSGKLFVDTIYPLYRESLFEKEFELTNLRLTRQGVDYNLLDKSKGKRKFVPKATLDEDGVYVITIGSGKSEKFLYVGISSVSTSLRLYLFVKDYFGVSRDGKDHTAGHILPQYMKEEGIDRIRAFNVYWTPILYPNMLGKKDTYDFLVEIKKMLIGEFSPELNQTYQDEVVDMSDIGKPLPLELV